jgi:hypothetical protein
VIALREPLVSKDSVTPKETQASGNSFETEMAQSPEQDSITDEDQTSEAELRPSNDTDAGDEVVPRNTTEGNGKPVDVTSLVPEPEHAVPLEQTRGELRENVQLDQVTGQEATDEDTDAKAEAPMIAHVSTVDSVAVVEQTPAALDASASEYKLATEHESPVEEASAAKEDSKAEAVLETDQDTEAGEDSEDDQDSTEDDDSEEDNDSEEEQFSEMEEGQEVEDGLPEENESAISDESVRHEVLASGQESNADDAPSAQDNPEAPPVNDAHSTAEKEPAPAVLIPSVAEESLAEEPESDQGSLANESSPTAVAAEAISVIEQVEAHVPVEKVEPAQAAEAQVFSSDNIEQADTQDVVPEGKSPPLFELPSHQGQSLDSQSFIGEDEGSIETVAPAISEPKAELTEPEGSKQAVDVDDLDNSNQEEVPGGTGPAEQADIHISSEEHQTAIPIETQILADETEPVDDVDETTSKHAGGQVAEAITSIASDMQPPDLPKVNTGEEVMEASQENIEVKERVVEQGMSPTEDTMAKPDMTDNIHATHSASISLAALPVIIPLVANGEPRPREALPHQAPSPEMSKETYQSHRSRRAHRDRSSREDQDSREAISPDLRKGSRSSRLAREEEMERERSHRSSRPRSMTADEEREYRRRREARKAEERARAIALQQRLAEEQEEELRAAAREARRAAARKAAAEEAARMARAEAEVAAKKAEELKKRNEKAAEKPEAVRSMPRERRASAQVRQSPGTKKSASAPKTGFFAKLTGSSSNNSSARKTSISSAPARRVREPESPRVSSRENERTSSRAEKEADRPRKVSTPQPHTPDRSRGTLTPQPRPSTPKEAPVAEEVPVPSTTSREKAVPEKPESPLTSPRKHRHHHHHRSTGSGTEKSGRREGEVKTSRATPSHPREYQQESSTPRENEDRPKTSSSRRGEGESEREATERRRRRDAAAKESTPRESASPREGEPRRRAEGRESSRHEAHGSERKRSSRPAAASGSTKTPQPAPAPKPKGLLGSLFRAR